MSLSLGFFRLLGYLTDRWTQPSISSGITVASAGFLYSFLLMIPLAHICLATDTLTPSLEIMDGSTLVSAGKSFEFGFFSTANSTYLGIWYFSISPRTVVWIANRNAPVNSSSGIVKMVADGNVILQDNTGRILWSTNVQKKSPQGTVLKLLDSGNLVLKHDNKAGNAENLWESFDQLSDTWLLGMKLGKDSRTGLNRYFTSWKSADDPSPGQFTYSISPRSPPTELLLRTGNSVVFRTGPWNGVGFSGVVSLPNLVFNLKVIVNQEEMYYEYARDDQPTITRSTLSYLGKIHRYVWNSSSLEWLVMYTLPNDPCDEYGHCGANSICTISDPIICSCLTGYMPKSPQDWEIRVWSGGCISKHQLNCSSGEGFVEMKSVKVPDHYYWMSSSMTLKECQAECLKNCSCTAYSNSNVSGKGSGCLLWYGDLNDIRRLSAHSNQNLYIRVSATDLDSKKKKQVVLVVMASSSAALAVLFLACFVILKKRAQGRGRKLEAQSRGMADLELSIFKMISIAEATNHFSESNKIGEGGFGPVYKGRLETGQEIAVKRLSVDSNQGLKEFKNEVILISKLQHRNLVRLLGCCIEGEERMLIYEYMPSRSLNNYIYGLQPLFSCLLQLYFDSKAKYRKKTKIFSSVLSWKGCIIMILVVHISSKTLLLICLESVNR